jgi:protease I
MKNELELADPILMEKDIDKEPIPGVKEVLESTGIKRLRVAILSEEGFEEVELTSPKNALERAGIKVDIISPKRGKIKAWDKIAWGKEIKVDINLHDANADDYDALVLPGGVMNPDKLRQNKEAVSFVKHFIRTGKTIAAICHGPQTLIETGMIEGKTMTSFPSLQTDLMNAGVDWVDREMVHYGQFITSRRPDDLDAFNNELINSLF